MNKISKDKYELSASMVFMTLLLFSVYYITKTQLYCRLTALTVDKNYYFFERMFFLQHLSAIKSKKLSKIDKFLKLLFLKKDAIITTLGALLVMMITPFVNKIDVHKKPISIELTCPSSYVKNETVPLNNTSLLNSFTFYYENSAIDLKELKEENTFYKEQKNKLKIFNNFLSKLNTTQVYYFLITSYSSTEKVIRHNTFNDNYQLSEARSNSVKKFIISKFIDNNISIDNIKFEIENRSNYKVDNTNHELSRQTIIEVYTVK